MHLKTRFYLEGFIQIQGYKGRNGQLGEKIKIRELGEKNKKKNEKGRRKKEENYIKKGEKGLKNASFWAKISKKIRGGSSDPPAIFF